MKKIKKIQGAPAGRVKGSSQGSSLEPLRIREGGIPTARNPPRGETQGPRVPDFFHFFDFLIFFVFWPFRKKSKKSKNFFHFFHFFWFFEKNQKNQNFFFDFFGFSKKIKKMKKIKKKSKKSRVPPQGGSRAPARAPAWSHSGSGREGFPRPETPHAGRPRVPDFFHFFDFFDFFRFLAFSKKIKKIKKIY